MSNILKGLLNESNPFYGHNDPAKEYGADAPSYPKRGRHSQTPDDDDGNPFAEYERQQRDFAIGRAKKAAAEKQQRDSDHDRLATGTNEDTGLDIDRSIPGRTIARVSDKPGKISSNKSKLPSYNQRDDEYDLWSGKTSASIHDDEEDTFDTDYTGDEEGELNEISNEKLAQYKTAAAADAGKADKAGDYKRGDKRFSGIVKATKKQFANDEKKSAIGQGLKEAIGEKEYILYINGKPAAKYTNQPQAEKDIIDVKRKYPQAHLELKHEVCDLQTIKHVNEGDSIFGDVRPSIGQAIKTHNKIAQQTNPNHNKFVWKRPNQINGSHSEQELLSMGFRKSTKYNMWGGTNDMWNKLSESLDENLGDQLKSKSLEALTLLKQQIEQKRAEDLAQWEQDFRKNVANKMRSQQIPSQEVTPVAQPGEKHSALKARLAQLNSAIEKQAVLDKLIDKVERKGLMTPAMQNDTDTRMHVKYGAKDNYQSLNKKLDNAIQMLQNRLAMRKLSGLKEEQEIKFVLVVDGQPKFKFPTREEALKVLNDYKAQFPKANAKIEPRAIAKTMYEEDELDENCWKGYHKEGNKELFGKTVPNCVKNEDIVEGTDIGAIQALTDEALTKYLKAFKTRYGAGDDSKAVKDAIIALKNEAKRRDSAGSVEGLAEEQHSCPHCGGELVSEDLMNEKKDACYYKVKSRYKVWPSAYASGALVKCRKKGADSWGNGGKKNESSILEGIERADENLHQWFKEKWVRFGPDGKIRGDCARGDDSEGKPKCLPQAKAHSLGKKGRASAAARKRREDPNPERSGKAINVNTKKKANEEVLDEKWSQKYKDSINCSNPKGFSQKAHCAGKKK